jgi:hypothetical protein
MARVYRLGGMLGGQIRESASGLGRVKTPGKTQRGGHASVSWLYGVDFPSFATVAVWQGL